MGRIVTDDATYSYQGRAAELCLILWSWSHWWWDPLNELMFLTSGDILISWLLCMYLLQSSRKQNFSYCTSWFSGGLSWLLTEPAHSGQHHFRAGHWRVSERGEPAESKHEHVLSLSLTAGVTRPEAPKTLHVFTLCFYVSIWKVNLFPSTIQTWPIKGFPFSPSREMNDFLHVLIKLFYWCSDHLWLDFGTLFNLLSLMTYIS